METPKSSPVKPKVPPPTPFIDHTNQWNQSENRWVFTKKSESHNH